MCSLNNFYTCIGDSLFYLVYMRAFRVIIHLHAGAQMYNINTTLFDRFYQTIHSSAGTSATGEKGYHFSFVIILFKMHAAFVKCHEAPDSRTCLRDYIASYDCDPCYFFSIFDNRNSVLRKNNGEYSPIDLIFSRINLFESDLFLELVKSHIVNYSSKTVL